MTLTKRLGRTYPWWMALIAPVALMTSGVTMLASGSIVFGFGLTVMAVVLVVAALVIHAVETNR